MSLDLTHRHATGLQGQDLVIEPSPTGLVLGHDLRLKAAVSIMWDVDGQFAKLTFERFLAFAVAGVALGIGDRLVFVVP